MSLAFIPGISAFTTTSLSVSKMSTEGTYLVVDSGSSQSLPQKASRAGSVLNSRKGSHLMSDIVFVSFQKLSCRSFRIPLRIRDSKNVRCRCTSRTTDLSRVFIGRRENCRLPRRELLTHCPIQRLGCCGAKTDWHANFKRKCKSLCGLIRLFFRR